MINQSDLQFIQDRAATLTEKYNQGAADNQGLLFLDLKQLKRWEQNIYSENFTLKDRIKLLSSDTNDKSQLNISWINTLEELINRYFLNNKSIIDGISIKQKEFSIPYEEILQPFISYSSDQLNKNTPLLYKWFVEKAFKDYQQYHLENLSALAILCLSEDFQRFQKDFPPNKTSGYIAYARLFYSGYVISFFRKYSALARLLINQTQVWIYSINTLITRLESESINLSKFFFHNKPLGKITRITPQSGPSYSVLGPNCKIQFQNNHYLMYKLKSGKSDILYNQLIKWLNKNRPKLSFRNFKVLDKIDYSWHEYLPHTSCETENEIKRFYIKLGFLAGVIQILGSTDYHFGNILAVKEDPILIDNETLLPSFENSGRIHKISRGKILAGPPNYDMLGAFHYQLSANVMAYNPVDDFTKPPTWTKINWIGKNIPLLQKVQVDPKKYIQEMKDGYRKSLSFMSGNHKDFVRFIQSQLNGKLFFIRYIFRSSLVYVRLLLDSLQPKYLKNGTDRSIFFEQLFSLDPKRLNSKTDLGLIPMEIQHLEKYFVPRFQLAMNNLTDEKKKGVKRKLDITLMVENIKHNLSKLNSPDHIQIQLEILDDFFLAY